MKYALDVRFLCAVGVLELGGKYPIARQPLRFSTVNMADPQVQQFVMLFNTPSTEQSTPLPIAPEGLEESPQG